MSKNKRSLKAAFALENKSIIHKKTCKNELRRVFRDHKLQNESINEELVELTNAGITYTVYKHSVVIIYAILIFRIFYHGF